MTHHRKLDLLRDCNDQGVPPLEFKGIFCKRCRNPQCVNAGWSGSTWADRMSTQVDRLLANPSFADPSDSRFDRLRDLDFRQVEAPIVYDSGDAWAGPQVHLADLERQTRQSAEVEAAVKSLSETRVKKPVSVEPEPDDVPVVEVPPKAPRPNPKHYLLDSPPTSSPQPQPPPIREGNTFFPEEGAMIDGSPPPARTQEAVVDPWAPKPSGGPVTVPVGARVRMGGDTKK